MFLVFCLILGLFGRLICTDLTQSSFFFFQEQAAKEAAAAASKKAFEAKFENCSEDILAARELAASSTEAVAKSRKVRGVHVRGYGVHVRFIVIDHFLAST